MMEETLEVGGAWKDFEGRWGMRGTLMMGGTLEVGGHGKDFDGWGMGGTLGWVGHWDGWDKGGTLMVRE